MLTRKGSRAAHKFRLKYGFDSHLLADGLALGLNEEQLAAFLNVSPEKLSSFFNRPVRKR